jgi:aldehyde:ferredoxin oxidoreductase
MTLEVLRKVGIDRYGDPEMFTDADWSFKPKYAQRVFECENLFAVSDMTGTCKFAAQEALFVEGIGMADFARLLTVVTGVRFEAADLVRAAEREFALERAFNAREGVRRIDDYPYAYWYELKHGQPHPDFNPERYRLSRSDFDMLLDEYYRLRGCDTATGIPERAALCSLGLQDVADDLAARGLLAPGGPVRAAAGPVAVPAPTPTDRGPLGPEGLR